MADVPDKTSAPRAGAQPGGDELARIESVALELARIAGAELVLGLSTAVEVRYKTPATLDLPARDPVSDIDTKVEELVLQTLRARFPEHALLGEESGWHGSPDAEWVWAVDPIDGTSNFIHGFPLFAASIGVLHRGMPVAGAVWCSTSHDLQPGVFHAHEGGELRFEERPLRLRPRAQEAATALLGDPGKLESQRQFDRRATGSAAIECAFVACRILGSALFRGPRTWDVAGGLALVRAAKLPIHVRGAGAWHDFRGFIPEGATDPSAAMIGWKEQVAIGLRGDPKELEGFVLL